MHKTLLLCFIHGFKVIQTNIYFAFLFRLLIGESRAVMTRLAVSQACYLYFCFYGRSYDRIACQEIDSRPPHTYFHILTWKENRADYEIVTKSTSAL